MLGGALGPIFRAAMGEHFRYAVGVVAAEDHPRRLGWPAFREGRDAERDPRATNVQHENLAEPGGDFASGDERRREMTITSGNSAAEM